MAKVKLIVCVRSTANTGKSSTIQELLLLLHPKSAKAPKWNKPSTQPNLANLPKTINVEVWVKGSHVGLDSQGDVPKTLKSRLDLLAQNNCDIIFCTCRTKQGSPKVVKSIAKKYGYNLIWTSPYVVGAGGSTQTTIKAMNQKKAAHLETFI